MELGLQFEDITYFESLESHAVTHEETLETAIPEYCPDMSRIVEAVGELFVQEKIPAEDRYTVAGTVKVTVLPAATVTLWGWVMMRGIMCTVSEAIWLVTLPKLLETTHLNCVPLSA